MQDKVAVLADRENMREVTIYAVNPWIPNVYRIVKAAWHLFIKLLYLKERGIPMNTLHTRLSGVLVHPTSSPSPYGIGDLGQGAYDFIDFLKASGQSLWQVLPLGPTGFGDSPYQSFSAFAGPVSADQPG